MEGSEEFKKMYLGEIGQETIDKQQRAFDAMLAYERNCNQKYDRENLPSLPPKRGEYMLDFAILFNTTVEEMKKCEEIVDKYIKKRPLERKKIAFFGYQKHLQYYIKVDRLIDEKDEVVIIKDQQDLHGRKFTDLIVCNHSYKDNKRLFTRLIDCAVDYTKLTPQFIGEIRSSFY